jgi:hypothetical protein
MRMRKRTHRSNRTIPAPRRHQPAAQRRRPPSAPPPRRRSRSVQQRSASTGPSDAFPRASGCRNPSAFWSMRDRRFRCLTPRKTSAYPRPVAQKPGLGFPLARIGAVFSLACGAVLDLAICRYAGKGQRELGMLRKLWSIFKPGDVMLAARLMCAWTEMVVLKLPGVDCVCRRCSGRSVIRNPS